MVHLTNHSYLKLNYKPNPYEQTQIKKKKMCSSFVKKNNKMTRSTSL